ncbi:hypothetical protein [Acidovorax sp. CCYZU-2555]|uniref:hypothetical protein n=1 Tax=Acidovorax sp. CCYZU-2555 TaxID=2835042 RepID=UPI001BD143E2|nr:hypothetical protein [Acidovorax sp. CCYZU-2555]MBS7776921.1 hypothetical protein [Acidovorax sp. CCYZU-2555]
MQLQKLTDFYFYDKEQKNSKGFFYILKLNDNDELRRVENFFYDEKADELFVCEE